MKRQTVGGKVEALATSHISRLQAEAEKYLPGGVAASGRFNPSLGYALYLSRADGSRIYDVDGKEYIDFNLSHGACILGHNHPTIRRAIEAALDIGCIAGYETEHTTELAKRIVEIIPCAERVRFVTTGSEATATTLRLARGFTGKRKIIKFWGHLHGSYDYVMYNVHSPLAAVERGRRVPLSRESNGIPADLDDLIVVLPWQDEEALELVIGEEKDDIAAIIMEPINYNQGCIVASKAYMEFVREIATDNGIVLIYDEVLSAFRTGPGCAQEYYGVTPDLCAIGKAVSNGVPLAVVAGKREIMQEVTPLGEVLQSGTYSGNLISVMSGLATLNEITSEGFYDHVYAVTGRLYDGLNELFVRAGIPARAQGLGARFGIYFGITEEVKDFADTIEHDGEMASQFIRACAKNGVYFHSYGRLVKGHSGISASHTLADIDDALDRIGTALGDIKKAV